MITKEDIERKRTYIDTLEPGLARSACYQLLEDLEKMAEQLELAQSRVELARDLTSELDDTLWEG